jgi:PKD repeat protein
MKNRIFYRNLTFIIMMAFFVSSCTDEIDRPVFPISATISHSIKDKQVAFTALTHSAVSWSWTFGDGQNSTEQNPVHVYTNGGYYQAILIATDGEGKQASDTLNLALNLSTINYLTGNQNAPGYKGKTWRLTTNHTTNSDYLANCDAALTTAAGTPKPLPNGVFGQLGFPDCYKDEFTFYFDGKYVHNNSKSGGSSFSALLHQMVLNGGKDITNVAGKDYGMCLAKYTPETGAKFTLTDKKDLTVASVYGAGGKLTFTGVTTLNFTGTEFVGFRDAQREIIINKINDTSMQLIMFMAAGQKYYPANTHALILSFEVVK